MSQQAKVLLAFAGVFLAGAIAGGGVTLRMEKERVQNLAAEKERAATEKVAADLSPRMLKDLTGRLNLKAEQRKEVAPIIDRAALRIAELSTEYNEATQEYRVAIKTLREDMEREVGVLLDPEQRKKLDKMQADWTKQFNQRFTRPPGPGPGFDGFDRGGRRGGPPGGTGSTSSPFQGRQMRRSGGPPNLAAPPGPADPPAAPAPASGVPTR